jgi:16S rRNA (cytidine1402-2'-O)-methyltransferase
MTGNDQGPDAVRRDTVVPAGVLVVVATPIGNLGDLSVRAQEALRQADAVACEDTRRTGKLFEHAGIARRRFIVVNDHTEAAAVADVQARLARGERVAVVSDAGTPGISDPGERLVRAAAASGFRVEVVPGPSAAITALVASGLATGRFVFEGFLPRKGSGRSERLHELAGERRTMILYEAPHRLARAVEDLAAVMDGQRRVVLARELTKRYEDIWRGTLAEAVEHCSEVKPRGEYVVVLEGAPPPIDASDDAIRAELETERSAGYSTRDAVGTVSERLAVPRRRVYAIATGASPAAPERHVR